MTRCDDGCGRYACKTWDTHDREPRRRFKALCSFCWKLRHATKVVSSLIVPTYRCGACEENPDWRGCDPHGK